MAQAIRIGWPPGRVHSNNPGSDGEDLVDEARQRRPRPHKRAHKQVRSPSHNPRRKHRRLPLQHRKWRLPRVLSIIKLPE